MAGYWAVKCGGFGGSIQVSTNESAKINVNDNNLLIAVNLVDNGKGNASVYYSDVIESQNDIIDWNSVSKRKSIAKLSLKNGILHVFWNGFYDDKTKKYIWLNDPDFVVATEGNRDVKMGKCEFK
ncbi:hypothetical protein [Lelliottia wanjuensis]|uniref:hypothetical protein n=1 Tax=Lelliottia wanjuensis TaxID=3050585 RepID=UPI0025506C08|nr:hypothetical protein [Lelliottia sp. V104_15]MDK9605830.1 hypothetical protein [Lelliottia sp. V104_15]